MRNDGQKPKNKTNGAFRAFSSYFRIVSSGAANVASTVRSAASAFVERDNDATNDQVLWAGFDKLEWDGGISRQVLQLAYRSGFQVWDVEEADNVRNLVSRHDGAVSFVQVLHKPITSKRNGNKFAENRPLLAVCADASLSGDGNAHGNRTTSNCNDPISSGFMPRVVWFYSLRSQSYVHVLKFRSAIYSVRCSSRVVAISQAAQIHCLDAATLEKEYTILTNPIATGISTFGGKAYGPLAVGPRWLAYSGSPVIVSNSGCVNKQHITPFANFPSSVSNGSLVVHYAKESSKQLAAGIVTLGDIGYKKLSRYYSELVPDGHNSSQKGNLGWKPSGKINGHLPDAENVGMVIVRDIVGKSLIAQFRAHKSPISLLCFDPSGTLLVTVSVQGHNINVFRIMPGLGASSSTSDSSPSYIHLYTLQRGVTNAVIQDISFSDDSRWIMISSSRGTNHLFSISPYGGPVDFFPPNSTSQMINQHNLYASGPPIALTVVSRIRSSVSGAIASVFHNCKVNILLEDTISLNTKYHLLVFSSGCMVQYYIRGYSGQGMAEVVSGPALDSDTGLVVEVMQKWDICWKHIRREREDNSDIYGENGNSERRKNFPEEIEGGDGGCIKGRCSFGKTKISPDEKDSIFISEAEIQMHEAQIPLWAKSEIYFQCMTSDGCKVNVECGNGGEMEIERIPTRVIEARSKHLVPVFDYLRATKFQPARISNVDNTTITTEFHNRIEGAISGWEGLYMQIDTMNELINSSSNSPKSNTRLDFVNRTSTTVEGQIKPVNKNVEAHIIKNHVQDDVVEFD